MILPLPISGCPISRQDPNAPRTRARGTLQDVRSSFTSSRPLSPRTALPPLSGTGNPQTFNGHATGGMNGSGFNGNGAGSANGGGSSPRNTPGRTLGLKRTAQDVGLPLESRLRSAKAARAGTECPPLC